MGRLWLRHYSAFIPCKLSAGKNRSKTKYAPVVKLAYTLDLGSNSERSAGSSPVRRTILAPQFRCNRSWGALFCLNADNTLF